MTSRKIIKEARLFKELSQEDVAKRLRKPQSYISKIEQGERRVDIEEFIILCKAIEVDPVDILCKIMKELDSCLLK